MARIYGWTGRTLRVDLSAGRIEEMDTSAYGPKFIGGRGMAAAIAWEEIPPGVGAFAAENPLMFFAGPLTGTTAPCSGRTAVGAVSPQTYPIEWFIRSNMGGHWGPELKYAGFDGLIVTGKSEHPVYLWIHDGQAEIRDARSLWGLGTYETQARLMEELGPSVRVAAIGQAGEHLSRIAIINTETESAAGQGGFGAVMGGKKLKAIAVRGSGIISIARPEEFLRKSMAISQELQLSGRPGRASLDPQKVARYGEKFQACTQQCPVRCVRYYSRVPGVVHKGAIYAGQIHCVAGRLPGGSHLPFYDWDIGFEAGFEVAKFANDYGLNHWDLIRGIIPYLTGLKQAGILAELDGWPIDFNNPEFWLELLRKIAYREGVGDALAEGGRRAAEILGLGLDFIDKLYVVWGFPDHWDGRRPYGNRIVFPFWLVTALQWAMDSRDPMGSGHGYGQSVMMWCPLGSGEGRLTWEEMIGVGKKVYGTGAALDPASGYQDKAIPAVWHCNRSVLKDSAPVDDQMFPRVFSCITEDCLARAEGMEGPQFEHHLLMAATGAWESPEEIDQACERIFNLERALHIRNWGRSRREDERVIPYFEQVEAWVNPVVGEAKALDREKFLKLMDEYYELRGWEVRSGRPTRTKLVELGLEEVAEELEGRGLLPG